MGIRCSLVRLRARAWKCFKPVMIEVLDKLPEEEVNNIIFSRDYNGDSLLSCAVKSESVEMFKTMTIDVLGKLHEIEVKHLISSPDYGDDSLLSCAVESRSVEMFKTVMIDDVLDKLPEEEVREMILRRDDDDAMDDGH